MDVYVLSGLVLVLYQVAGSIISLVVVGLSDIIIILLCWYQVLLEELFKSD
jgi:hypothetical protein